MAPVQDTNVNELKVRKMFGNRPSNPIKPDNPTVPVIKADISKIAAGQQRSPRVNLLSPTFNSSPDLKKAF